MDLEIVKEAYGGTVSPGDTVTYTVYVTELASIAATNVVITDLLPTGTSWLSDTSAACGLTRSSGSGEVYWSTSSWGASVNCSFVLTVSVESDACATDRLTNTVVITSATVDSNLTNNSADSTNSPAVLCQELGALKTGPLSVLAGDLITYTIVVTNGVSPALDVDVTSDLEGNPRPQGAASDIGAYESAP